MKSADSNLFLYAANSASPHAPKARAFFDSVQSDAEFVICELVLVEIYMLLRNPVILPKPLSAKESVGFCKSLRSHPTWQHVDYSPDVSEQLWHWLENNPKLGFRQVIDARLALTLIHHGITEFATANVKDFQAFPFGRVWSPIL